MDTCFGTKFLTLFPDNPSKGRPFIDGLMLLNDAESGKTLAILDARYLTALRTGAAGGVGVRHFSRTDCKSAGIIGAGQQGFYQAVYAAQARSGITDIYLFDTAQKSFEDYTKRLSNELRSSELRRLSDRAAEIHVCDTVEQLLEKSEIVITATPATSPVVPDEPELLRGKCFVAIGSYKQEMRELPNAIWKLVDNVYTELPFAMEESGDLSQPLADGLLSKGRVKYIGDWLSQEQKPLPLQGQTTYFKSVGMGLLDLNVAQLIYNEALRMEIGQKVNF
jgi:ornithine cyclodeaminase/alanine dehydrogenase-like protein (mu-crystallin family)